MDSNANLCGQAERELAALRAIVVDLHWMARRYVSGRSSYAPGLFNQHTRTLLALGVPLRPVDGTVWALDGMGREYDGLTEEEAAEALAADHAVRGERNGA